MIVPIKGVDDNAKNQCGFAPCSLSNAHDTITLHVPHRQGRATTGGSASSRARLASSTASAGRCRPSATWTATSMWSKRSHAERIAALTIVGTIVVIPLMICVLGPSMPPGDCDERREEPGVRQHRAARGDDSVHGLHPRATCSTRLRAFRVRKGDTDDRDGAADQGPPAVTSRVACDDDRRGAVPCDVRVGGAAREQRRRRRSGTEAAGEAQRRRAARAGDRPAVAVHVPLSRPTAESRPHNSSFLSGRRSSSTSRRSTSSTRSGPTSSA